MPKFLLLLFVLLSLGGLGLSGMEDEDCFCSTQEFKVFEPDLSDPFKPCDLNLGSEYPRIISPFLDPCGTHLVCPLRYSQKLFICEFPGCGFVNLDEKIMIEHMEYHQIVLNEGNITKNSLENIDKKEVANNVCFWRDCNYILTDKESFFNHLNRHLFYLKKNNDSFICPWPGCDYSCRSKPGLKSHIKSQHIFNELFRCSRLGCNFSSYYRSNFNKHMYDHKNCLNIQQALGLSAQERFACHCCDEVFNSKHDVVDHIRSLPNFFIVRTKPT